MKEKRLKSNNLLRRFILAGDLMANQLETGKTEDKSLALQWRRLLQECLEENIFNVKLK